MNQSLRLLYLGFFLSGAAALVYQIVWQRMLTLVFGLSTISVAAVLAAFLAGLALGARLAGPLADRSARPIRLYAGIELGIALLGVATLFFIPPLMDAFAVLYGVLEPGWYGSNLVRFGLAFVAIGIPSTLMGATMPVMARMVTNATGSTAQGFGQAYALNTLGSVLGAAIGGFLLLKLIGAQNALLCAVAVNALVAGLAWLVDRSLPAEGGAAAPGGAPEVAVTGVASGPATAGYHPRFAVLVAALSGFLALAYEVAWIRLLAIFTLNSVYIFTMVVSVYLVALALGAALTTWLLRHRRVTELPLLATCQLVQALLVPVLLAAAPLAIGLRLTSGELSERAIFLREYLLVAAVVFVPTLLIGVTLPLLVSLASRTTADAGRLVGRIYAWNAIGTISGAALAGVVLIPLLGLRGCLLLLAGGNLAIAAGAMVTAAAPPRWSRGLVPGAAAAFALLLALLPANTRFYLPTEIPGEDVIYYAEGPSATIHVAEYDDGRSTHRTLYVDSKSVAGTYDEIVTDQKMLAHLPLLLHPEPERALTVGFGTGGTSYSMLQHKVEAHCVEIEPRVPEAAHLFESQNGGIVGPGRDSRFFRLILDDARAWLHVAPERYDVIVTDLTSIQYRGNGNLYTRECFELVQQQLRPGGIGAAWVPITGITPEALRVLARTFRSVFPHTSVWYSINLPTDFVILIGTEEPLALDLQRMRERINAPLVERDLAAIGMDNVYKLTAGLLLAEDAVARFVGPGPLHTDDLPILDYLTHAAPYHNTFSENMVRLLAHRSDPGNFVARWPAAAGGDPPPAWPAWRTASSHLIRGHVAMRTNTPDRVARARAAYTEAIEIIPDDARTRALLAELTR